MNGLKKFVRRNAQKIKQAVGKGEKTDDSDYDTMVAQLTANEETAKRMQLLVRQIGEHMGAINASLTFYAQEIEKIQDVPYNPELYQQIQGILEALKKHDVHKMKENMENPLVHYQERIADAKPMQAKRDKLALDYDYQKDRLETMQQQTALKQDSQEMGEVMVAYADAGDNYNKVNTEVKDVMQKIVEDNSVTMNGSMQAVLGVLSEFSQAIVYTSEDSQIEAITVTASS